MSSIHIIFIVVCSFLTVCFVWSSLILAAQEAAVAALLVDHHGAAKLTFHIAGLILYDDLFHLLEKNANAPHKPKLYVSCGDQDFLYPQHLRFIPALKKHGWDVTRFDKPDTTHSWAFWDDEIAKFIPWMLEK